MNETQRDWSVDIHENGRSGTVVYREPSGSLSFHWEFGLGNTVASIGVADEAAWRQKHAWAVGRRGEILRRIAGEVIRLKAPGCRAEIDDRRGWINIQQGTTPPRSPDLRNQFLRFYELKRKIMLITAVVLTVGALVFWGVKQSLSVRVPHGTPLGDSVRAAGEIATLIQTLETCMPSLGSNESPISKRGLSVIINRVRQPTHPPLHRK